MRVKTLWKNIKGQYFPFAHFSMWGDIFPSRTGSVADVCSGKYLPTLPTSLSRKVFPPLLLAILTFSFSLLLSAANVHTPTWSLDADQGDGRVEFTAIGKPKALKIRGNGEKPKGKIFIQIPASTGMTNKISGKFVFDLSSLDTGISLRNRHLREKYLEVQKFPKAELELIKLDQLEKVLSENKVNLDALPFEGVLSLHGVKKAITGKADVKKENQRLSIEATFDLNIKDFAIETPGFAGITVADRVEVAVKLHPLLLPK